ncbi:MAG: hypothetical protein ACLPJH_11220 [Myxococcaceae bacterium]
MPGSLPPLTMVHGEALGHRPIRFLLAWTNEVEAVQFRLGRQGSAPENQEINDARLKAMAALAQRQPFEAQDPIVSVPEAQPLLDAVAARADVKAQFTQFNWHVAMVDLRRVLSFQKLVAVDESEERTAAAAKSMEDLFAVCLPAAQPLPPQGAMGDPDGKGVTVSSLNPNLRYVGSQLHQAMVNQTPTAPPTPMQAITLLITMGASYLQVIRYKGRSFVRDGYHRSTRLLGRGVQIAPCIFIEGRSFEELSAPPGSLSYEVLYGPHPPLLTDFADDTLASDGRQLAVRKVIRVKVEEFLVPR